MALVKTEADRFSVTGLHSAFAAEITGLDLAAPLDEVSIAGLRESFDIYGVLMFPDQQLSPEAQIAFSQSFGPLEDFPDVEMRKHGSKFYNISNVDEADRLFGAQSQHVRQLSGNAYWHTDSSYRVIPALASLLYALEAPADPAAGGQTEWADMFAAYHALPADLQRRLHGRHMVHYYDYERVFLDPDLPPDDAEKRRALPPVSHPVIRWHPERGRCSLYVTNNAGSEIGALDLEAGRALLQEVLEFIGQPQFVYRHQWRAGDLVMWDNRRLVHRLIPYDADKHRRVMRRTTVAGSGPVIGPWMAEAGERA